jgi:regulator of protease activity HflC (stomatin/prohibitin superfamily)
MSADALNAAARTAEGLPADPDAISDDEYRELRGSWVRRNGVLLGIVGLMFVFTLLVFWPKMLVTIHSGHEGVLWRRFTGTELDLIYQEGTHLILPWDILYVYDVRIQKVDYTVPVLSTDGLEIRVDVTIRYRPISKAVPQLHQNVGYGYVGTIIIPEVVTAVREIIGKYRPEQLYTLRTDEMQTQIVARAAREVRDRFLIVDDVLIRRIELPISVQQAIQRKLNQEQEALEYLFRIQKEEREKERKKIEAEGIAQFQDIVSKTLRTQLLQWKGIEATLELARSNNAKVVVVGGGGANGGLPLILNLPEAAPNVAAVTAPSSAQSAPLPALGTTPGTAPGTTPATAASPPATPAQRNTPPPRP